MQPPSAGVAVKPDAAKETTKHHRLAANPSALA
jgi:hypothetical protein